MLGGHPFWLIFLLPFLPCHVVVEHDIEDTIYMLLFIKKNSIYNLKNKAGYLLQQTKIPIKKKSTLTFLHQFSLFVVLHVT